MAVEWDSQRDLFEVPDEIAYFNAASLSPVLHAVRAAGEAALRQRARPWEIGEDDWFAGAERLRSLAGRLFGSGKAGNNGEEQGTEDSSAEGIALVPATSYGFAVAAANLSITERQQILVLADEYPSGVYTWRRLAERSGASIRTVTRSPGQTWTDAILAEIDDRIAIVSVPNVHWTDGGLIDIEQVAARTHAAGSRLVIDASQSLGVMPLDVAALRPDFVVSVGYKWLLGPFGRGYLWVAEEHRDGRPLEENWIVRAGSDDFAGLVDYRDDYLPGARRYDQGARTLFELTPMAVAALEQVLAWGPSRIAGTLATITGDIAARISAAGLDVTVAELHGPHVLGVRVPEGATDQVAAALKKANCFVARRGDAIRVSPHLHVTPADVDRLVTTLIASL
ncbi:selenocysteine lyase/cysteine desulfurase [Actinoplanes lutulentus]|uniref:Selenocysteine lyase/cysteine desulfurase n=1 Tax=Actinoplanes lutulentus TaxID=1287878 RepID=A0A327Z558_9ACTN|nr:aminotransferase class V-fold PLP-dependent enzyme [Actinoplanes lutulentus]MBB2947821.1 selenocysteine lyase/cysteine desulfurase [Actinoplanes lutulentus]RAK29865.1 selenocysteine lyase/cysteine desulfurase [Actinoplanes lutulentus]